MYIHIIHAVLLLVLLLPGVWMVTKGHRLQYAVIWLAIFTALSWGYQVFAPDEPTRFDRMVQDRQSYFGNRSGGEDTGSSAARDDDASLERGDGMLTPSDRFDPVTPPTGDDI